MVRYAGWLANTLLFALCCFLVADTANAIIAALLSEPAPLSSAPPPSSLVQASSWEQRQVIVRRNLFHSSDLAPEPPEPEAVPDILEETELPLKLWGTIASENPELAWASVEELDSRGEGSKVVRVGDNIKSASVLAIERQRVVLLEKGVRRALTLEEESAGPGGVTVTPSASRSRVRTASRRSSPSRSARTARSARESMSARVKKLEEDRFEVDREDVRAAMSNPASLYTQARILPKVGDNGEIDGIEISAIKEGSVFEQVGIEEGDVITEIGGEPIQSVGQSSQLLSALTDGQTVDLTIRSANGEILVKQFQFPPQ